MVGINMKAETLSIEQIKDRVDHHQAYRILLIKSENNGNKNVFFCCFHDDRKNPNLHVYQDGRFKCFACGAFGDVVDVYRHVRGSSNNREAALSMLHEFGNGHVPTAPQTKTPSSGSPKKQAPLHPQTATIEEVERALEAHSWVKEKKGEGYSTVGIYPYIDSNGSTLYWKARMERSGEKWIRPFHFKNGTLDWRDQGHPNKKPLHLQVPKESDSKCIYVTEGEKQAHQLGQLGLPAVTSGGDTSAGGADWEIIKLRGFENAVIWPDNDDAGRKYADMVSVRLAELSIGVRLIDIDKLSLPEKGDVVDWLETHLDVTKEDIETLPVLKTIIPVEDQWPEPETIKPELLPVQSLLPQMIPEPLRAWVLDISERMQCPVDFVAVAAIVTAGTLIGAGCGIRPKKEDDWMVIPNLWGGVIGRPGSLKSPAIGEALKPLVRLEMDAKDQYDEAMKDFEVENTVFEAQRAGLKGKLKDIAQGKPNAKGTTETVKVEMGKLEEPPKPIWKRYKTNDATIEKIGELLSENPRGLLLYRDELVGQLATWDKEGRESDRAFFLEAWNGYGSITSDRIGRGTVFTKNLCVSLFGGIQPNKLETYLYRATKGLENDGLVQRLQLMVYPDDREWKRVDRKPDTEAKNRAFNLYESLSEMDFLKIGALPSEDEDRPFFRFDEEGQQVFNEWWEELETMKLPAEENPVLEEHWAKYRSLMPSLALIFHLLGGENHERLGSVPGNAARMAAAWCEYLETHAERIYGLVIDTRALAMTRLANKIKKKKLPEVFTEREVYRKGWAYLEDTEETRKACEDLVDAGWLRPVEHLTDPHRPGQRPSPTYRINPKVWGEEPKKI